MNHFFLALDPAAFRDAGSFEDEMDELIDTMHETPAADPQTPVLVPGDLEAAEALRRDIEGVPISRALDDKLRMICERSGACYVLGLRDDKDAS
ncbi:Ldh family oxidoreductase [Bordetella holmesii]|uniref:Malate/L-lactate dehydrogenase domain protein n=1 Tax=Bordetella holmesii CDC-H585-BH TaxID=1331206 RepID=A0A158M7L0_9BORD|nr:Ldh family oxidoreductase [Bordetella holmesii]AMD46176.1 malate dehydrogenase [Bordetella holmesii H558]KAK84978.1 malate/L-lactate dehydrogenase domain protein [Bordetella holmesii CDC-H572-BH]KAK97172.1 malate/L-lactate dehydrogenase domain protein [Bordetella holmesii CDC-H585-BH]QGD57013.1 Ldh family oxidoreductase [Bordetella holmesii]QGD91309.1 Ldh family oxidoreductase [Bordetella holmesii]